MGPGGYRMAHFTCRKIKVVMKFKTTKFSQNEDPKAGHGGHSCNPSDSGGWD